MQHFYELFKTVSWKNFYLGPSQILVDILWQTDRHSLYLHGFEGPFDLLNFCNYWINLNQQQLRKITLHFFEILWNYCILNFMANKVDAKIVLLGKEYSGKTCLVERYLHGRFNKDVPYQNVSVECSVCKVFYWTKSETKGLDNFSQGTFINIKWAEVLFNLVKLCLVLELCNFSFSRQ